MYNLLSLTLRYYNCTVVGQIDAQTGTLTVSSFANCRQMLQANMLNGH